MVENARRLRVLVIIPVFAVFMAAASVVYGGLSWTGLDPEILVDGDSVNIIVYVPADDCNSGEIQRITVRVEVPRGAATSLVSETTGCSNQVATETSIINNLKAGIKVSVNVKSANRLQVDVGIIVNGGEEHLCFGDRSNGKVTCSADLG